MDFMKPFSGLLLLSFILSLGVAGHIVSAESSDPPEDPLNCKIESKDKSKDDKKKKDSKKDKPGSEEKKKEETESEKVEISEKREKELTFFEHTILYDSSTERARAINTISTLKKHEQKKFIDIMIRLAEQDTDPRIREACIRVLGRLKVKAAEEVFLKLLNDENRSVAQASVSSLEKIEAKNSAVKLFDLLKKQDFKKQNSLLIAILRTLGALKEKQEIEYLRGKLEDSSTHEENKQEIILYFGNVKAVEMKDKLIKIALDEDEVISMRAFAINALGRIGDKSTSASIYSVFKKIREIENSKERALYSSLTIQLITALIRLGDESVYSYIISAAKDDDANVRLRAVRQLGELGKKEARPILCYKYKKDPSSKVRREAKKAIMKIDGTNEEGE